MAYNADELDVTRHRRFESDDPDLTKIRVRWEAALRTAIAKLPEFRFRRIATPKHAEESSIELSEASDGAETSPAQSSASAPKDNRETNG
jgi:hypothetical protein